MGIFDSMLAHIDGDLDAEAIGGRLGLSEDRVERAIAALVNAHSQPGDTIELAADASRLPVHLLSEVMEQLGGETGLTKFAGLLGKGERRNPLFDQLGDLYGGGDPVNMSERP